MADLTNADLQRIADDMRSGYTVVSTEWTLFTEEQARNFGPDVIAGRCEWHDYGHNFYDGLIRARSTVND